MTGAVPVLERVRVRLAEAPMAMLPKLRAEGCDLEVRLDADAGEGGGDGE